jgi:hypothetical protein
MSDEKRIQQLLEEILDSNSTPEECCSRDPELLVEVRARWERIRRVEYQIDELFPSSSETPDNQEKTPILISNSLAFPAMTSSRS